MSRRTLPNWEDWSVVAAVTIAAVLFSFAGTAIEGLVGERGFAFSAANLAARILVGAVLAVAMLVVERRRERATVDDALRRGLATAAVLIIAGALVDRSGAVAPQGARVLLLLFAMPALSVLTHVLARRSERADQI